jgi:1-acyl-sn-glycerol-3-phosphate acyltransferase
MRSWLGRRWYDLAKTALFYTFSSAFSLRSTGGQYVPATGPLLLLSNHQSFMDPLLLGVALPRYVTYLTRETLHKNQILSRMMSSLGSIPIDHRGFSREGLQQTLDALNNGACVGVFPEGERTHDGTLEPFKPGISLLIKRTSALIVPAGIAGAYAAWSRHRKFPRLAPLFRPPTDATIAISIGRPIDPAKYEKVSREEMLDDLRRAVQVEMGNAEHIRRKPRNERD